MPSLAMQTLDKGTFDFVMKSSKSSFNSAMMLRSAFALPLLLAVVMHSNAQGQESPAEAFLEPYRSVQIPSIDLGIIERCLVEEGELVGENQVLARVNTHVLQASLETARAAKDAVGNLKAAETELAVKSHQLSSLQQLRTRGNATQREVERAMADRDVAQSRLLAVKEELEIRRLEHEKILAQIGQRTLRSPISGIVSEIQKEVGDFVSPSDPFVMTVVDLARLKAEFSVSIRASSKVRKGDRVRLLIGSNEQAIQGIVEFVAPIADPQSGTINIRVVIDNSQGKLLSGSICRWNVDESQSNSFADGPSRLRIIAESRRKGSRR